MKADFNLKDFPVDALSPWNIEVKHPQDYLLTLYDIDKVQIVSRLAAIAARRSEDQEDVLVRLGAATPAFSSRLLDELYS